MNAPGEKPRKPTSSPPHERTNAAGTKAVAARLMPQDCRYEPDLMESPEL